jgi:hypothetical protein
MHRPAFQREEGDEPLAGGWQCDVLITAVNCEFAEQV